MHACTTAPDRLTVGPASWSFWPYTKRLKPTWITETLILYKEGLKIEFSLGKFGKYPQMGELDEHNCNVSHHNI